MCWSVSVCLLDKLERVSKDNDYDFSHWAHVQQIDWTHPEEHICLIPKVAMGFALPLYLSLLAAVA